MKYVATLTPAGCVIFVSPFLSSIAEVEFWCRLHSRSFDRICL